MEFKHIKSETCPFCGIGLKYATYSGTHCNGQQNEDVQYWCGYRVKWIPNYGKEEVMSLCTNSEEYKKKKKQMDEIMDELKDFLHSKISKEWTVVKVIEEVRSSLRNNL